MVWREHFLNYAKAGALLASTFMTETGCCGCTFPWFHRPAGSWKTSSLHRLWINVLINGVYLASLMSDSIDPRKCCLSTSCCNSSLARYQVFFKGAMRNAWEYGILLVQSGSSLNGSSLVQWRGWQLLGKGSYACSWVCWTSLFAIYEINLYMW